MVAGDCAEGERAGALCRGAGGQRAGPDGPEAGRVIDRPGRAVETVHQECAGDSDERGDDRTSRPREAPAPEKRDSTNIRDGARAKTVLTEATGHVEIDVPPRPRRIVRTAEGRRCAN